MCSLPCLALLLVLSRAPLITLQQEEGPILTHCYDEAGNYTSNSQFSSNLWNTLLPSVASDAPLNLSSYSYSSVGQGPDRVFGFAQCMSAADEQDCRVCLNQSLTFIARLCPSRKQAVVRYDNCILRYSDQSFLSQPETIILVSDRNSNDATEPDVFLRQLGGLMRNLSRESAQSPSRFAVGSTDYNDLSNIYGMAQCTMDLPVVGCRSCLDQVISYIDNKTRARLYFPSCSIRYDTSAFYPAVGLPPPPSQPSPPAPSPPPPPREATSSNSGEHDCSSFSQLGQQQAKRFTGDIVIKELRDIDAGGRNSTRRNIIIGVTLAAVSVFVILIVCIWRASQRKHTRLFIEGKFHIANNTLSYQVIGKSICNVVALISQCGCIFMLL